MFNARSRALQGNFSLTAVGAATLITPPYMQTHFDVDVSAGMFATITVGAPGAQGAEVAGMHGAGVSTPSAAAVSVATAGFDRLMHIPNGTMFIIGLLSMMFAIGLLSAVTLFVGATTIDEGDIPNVQASMSPSTTGWAMSTTVAETDSRRCGRHSSGMVD